MIPEKKICGWCKVEKPASRFQVRRKPSGHTWLRLECKDCQNKLRKEVYANNEERRLTIINRNKKYSEINKTEVSVRSKKWREKNALRIKKVRREKYLANAEEVKRRRREYYKSNPQRHIAVVKAYIDNNWDKVLLRQRKLHKKKRATNSQYTMTKILRGRVTAAVKSRGVKCLRTKELIGCSVPELMNRLESMFTDGMTWGNQGLRGWHIDHIIPCAAFDLTNPEEQRKCFHYTNLQPLWWFDNLKKSDKIICEDGSLQTR